MWQCRRARDPSDRGGPSRCAPAAAPDQCVQSNSTVFVHGGAATPTRLLAALAEHGMKSGLRNVSLVHIHLEGPVPLLSPAFEGIFRSNNLFIGSPAREAVNAGRADCTPIFLSEIPILFHRKIIPLDVALVQVRARTAAMPCRPRAGERDARWCRSARRISTDSHRWASAWTARERRSEMRATLWGSSTSACRGRTVKVPRAAGRQTGRAGGLTGPGPTAARYRHDPPVAL